MTTVLFLPCSFSSDDPPCGGKVPRYKVCGPLGHLTTLIWVCYARFIGHLAWGNRKWQSCNLLLFLYVYLILRHMLKKSSASFWCVERVFTLSPACSWVFKGQQSYLTFIFQFTWNSDNYLVMCKLGNSCPRLLLDSVEGKRGRETGDSDLRWAEQSLEAASLFPCPWGSLGWLHF